MDKSGLDPKIIEQIKKLEEKYAAMGQDLSSYLDGLLYADYLTYWDYVHLDTLLSLQNPKTSQKDEMIFIIYHQITELYFKLILWEIDQLTEDENLSEENFIMRMARINNYFEHLVHSFNIMVDGMAPDQFLKFRMSLLPASGFQSGQYRLIEICSTDMINLVAIDDRGNVDPESPIRDLLEKLYWRKGASELATGKKTLTLKQFEEKYFSLFDETGEKYRTRNIGRLFVQHFQDAGQKEKMVKLLRDYDILANVSWPLAHYKSAVRYLHKDPEDIAATGGTNWQKYLPPRFQKIIFFPDLWSEKEQEDWGKSWVKREVFQEKE